MSTYTVKANLKHNGSTYNVGDTITLDEQQAAHLIKDGVIAGEGAEAPKAPEAPEAPKAEETTPEEPKAPEANTAAGEGQPEAGTTESGLPEGANEADQL